MPSAPDDAETPPLATLDDRRGAFAPEAALALYSDRIEVLRGGALAFRADLAALAELRLNVEPAGREVQIVCRMRFADGRSLAFGSRRAEGPGRWLNNAPAFQAFAPVLLARLAEQAPGAIYEEGPRRSTRMALAAAGLVMAAAGVAFTVYMALVRESAILALIGLPFTALGGAVVWVFRPVAPGPFDPADMAQRLSGGANPP